MTKNRWTLLPWSSMDRVVSVLTSGADKHGDAGWKERSTDEYLNAAMRHISEHLQGVTADHETGEPPLAHAVADLLIAMALEPVEVETPDGSIGCMNCGLQLFGYKVGQSCSLCHPPDYRHWTPIKPADILPHDIYGPITELPDWAEWVAVDADGGVWVYDSEPVEDDEDFFENWADRDEYNGKSLLVNQVDPPADWTQTKRRIER